MSNQGKRQASVRDVTGTAFTYEGDWHALFDMDGIPAGEYNGRLLAWINQSLGTSYTELNGAMAAFAIDQGFPSWNAMGAFDAGGLPATVKVTTEGDSITNGLGSTGLGWPPRAIPSLLPSGPAYTLSNIATPGITVPSMLGNFSSRVGAQYDPTKGMNVLTLMGGANDGAVVQRLRVYRDLRKLIRLAKLQGYQRAIIGTLIARSDGTGPGPNDGYFGGGTLQLNQDIRALWNSDLDADALMDFGIDPVFDEAVDADSTVYYADKLHPKDAGYIVMSDIAGPAISTAITTPATKVNAPATWSIFDISGFFTLSNSDRTIAWTSAGFSDANVRSLIGAKSGKKYWEIAVDSASFIGMGLVNFDFYYDYSQIRNPTNSDKGVGFLNYDRPDASLYVNGVAVTSSQPRFVNGEIAQFALDVDAKLFWYRKAGQNWNGNGSADPATGVGGVDVSFLGIGPYYAQGYILAQGGQLTSRFASAQMTGTIPSGFTALG